MIKIYHLASCTTNQRILKELEPDPETEYQEIKTEPITPEQLDEMKAKAGSYEALFSKRAMKYRGWGLHEKKLTESDFRKYILEEYTFLKRPVILVDNEIFVGNAPKVVKAAKEAIHK